MNRISTVYIWLHVLETGIYFGINKRLLNIEDYGETWADICIYDWLNLEGKPLEKKMYSVIITTTLTDHLTKFNIRIQVNL
jgi:hypothetical protein